MNEPLVSIIIPIYNVEQYIEHCLDSVCNQTYKNIEVILVNDGTPDKSGLIAKQYAEKDQRFKYFEKENGGLSSARNFGLDNCSGEYISFIDSDDWVEETFIEKMIITMLDNKSDIAICNMIYLYPDSGIIRKRTPKIKNSVTISGYKAFLELLEGKEYRFHAANKIFKKELFCNNSIYFPNGKFYEDVATIYKLVLPATYVSLLNDNLYFYSQRDGSITSSIIDNKKIEDLLFAVSGVIERSKIIEGALSDYIQTFYANNIIAVCNYIYADKDDSRLKMLSDDKYWYLMSNTMANKKITLINRIRALCIFKYWKLYCLMMKIIKH